MQPIQPQGERIVFPAESTDNRLYEDQPLHDVDDPNGDWTYCPYGCAFSTKDAAQLLTHLTEDHQWTGEDGPEPAPEDDEDDIEDKPTRRPFLTNERVTTFGEFAGVGILSAGCWWFAPGAGLICAGLCVILISVVSALSPRPPAEPEPAE